MGKESIRGLEFHVAGTVRTTNKSYVVLVDANSSSYFPIPCAEWHSQLVESIVSEKVPFDLSNYGMYFSFLSMIKAHDIFLTEAMFVVDRNGSVSCSFDVVEENELGVKISRFPLLLTDAVVICSIGEIPIMVYGTAGSDFTFAIDKSVAKQNVFSFICEEIARSERISAISEDADEEGT